MLSVVSALQFTNVLYIAIILYFIHGKIEILAYRIMNFDCSIG